MINQLMLAPLMGPCPICALSGGFHLRENHALRQVPEHALKESGWHQKGFVCTPCKEQRHDACKGCDCQHRTEMP